MTPSPQVGPADPVVALFDERFRRVQHELAVYERQETLSGRLDGAVTFVEYVLGGLVTIVPVIQNRTKLDPGSLALIVGCLGAVVIIAKIIRERFKPGQVLMGARFIVATLTCGIMQVENEKLEPNWAAKKIRVDVEFLSNLIGWVEEVEIAGLASATQVRRPAVKYLPVAPKASSRKN